MTQYFAAEPRFTADWTHAFRRNAARYLWGLRGWPVVYLELGIHEGRSACWMLEHVLVHRESRYIGIDCWGESPESLAVERRARRNLAPYGEQVRIIKGRIQEVLGEAANVECRDRGSASGSVAIPPSPPAPLPRNEVIPQAASIAGEMGEDPGGMPGAGTGGRPVIAAESVDVCYIDADHTTAGVLSISRLAWPLVRRGGIVIWDDVPRGDAAVSRGLERFLGDVAGEYDVLFQNWQLGVVKGGEW